MNRWLLCLLLICTTGCGVRLSDPIFAFKDLDAGEPAREGNALVFGTIVPGTWMAGDLDIVTFIKTGPADSKTYGSVTRANLFRVFFPRKMKNNSFIIELSPGVYEVDSFATSGWGRPVIWHVGEQVRPVTRVVITRPGVYDMGTLRVVRGEGLLAGYGFEHTAESTPERDSALAQAIAGTRWAMLPPVTGQSR